MREGDAVRFSLDIEQARVGDWRGTNFGPPDLGDMTLGVCEEAGELAHAVLKGRQGIREMRDPAVCERAIRDAVGDVCVYLFGVCDVFSWSLEEIIKETVDEVIKRNWLADSMNGKAVDGDE